VDGWNVTVNPTPTTAKSVSVVPNTKAQVPSAGAAPPSKAPGTVSINCGGAQLGFFRFGTPAPDFVSADRDFRGGSAATINETVDTSAANAAAAAVYQSERWGGCTYTLSVEKGSTYTVRLHFAELKLGPGERKFNVDINGRRVLSDFDIAAEAGKNKAVVKDFPSVSPDADSNIVIAFTRGSADEPKVCGIQILK